MDIKAYLDEKFDEILDTTPVAEITGDQIAGILQDHDACYTYKRIDDSTVDVTRADGEVLRVVLRCDDGSDAPTGWAVSTGPSTDELRVVDDSTNATPDKTIQDLYTAICAWLDE